MTVDVEARQALIASTFDDLGEDDLADCLLRCVAARRDRRRDGGWPWRCRLAGCCLCGPKLMGRWWAGFEEWAAERAPYVSALTIPGAAFEGDILGIAPLMRRRLRDLRDRLARRDHRWSRLSSVGMVGVDHVARLFIHHPGLHRLAVELAFRDRWPAVRFEMEQSDEWQRAFVVEDAVELLLARRGVEPLRIVVMPQREKVPKAAPTMSLVRGPLPVVVG